MAERALAAKPAANVHANAQKRPATTDAREESFEREADRAADAVMSGRPGAAVPGAPAPVIPMRRRDELSTGGGRPIDAATRTLMEAHFGYDFARVRIHADERAAQAADARGALAYTAGNDIVFARSGYEPHSPGGRRLLAHELTHVVQQAEAPDAAPAIQRKPKEADSKPPDKWYQDVIDSFDLSKKRIEDDRKKGQLVLVPPYYDNEKALVELCEAVDAKDKDQVPKKLDAVLKLGLWVHLQILSRALLTELSARIYEMGLESDADRLRKAYSAEDRFGPYNDDIYGARRKVDFLTRLVSGAIGNAKADAPDTLTAVFHQFTRTYVALREEYLAIDMKAVEEEMQRGHSWMVMRPGMSHEEYYRAIRGQIERWQAGLSTFIQQLMDKARQDLESPTPTGSGAALLKALRGAMTGELKTEIFPKDGKKNIAGESFEITKTTIGKGSGSIGDSFPPDKLTAKRTVPITLYDPEQEYVRELRATIAQFWRARMNQLDALGRIYGVLDVLEPEKDFGKGMQKAEQASDNAATIRNMKGGRLRLDSDDDWRDFLLQKYNDMVHPQPAATATAQQSGAPQPAAKKAATPAEAMHAIVEILFVYLRAFTVHARFTNIYDVGETSYLNRPFPRTLTGQLVHDCGVYALRVAYMLSLVRKELGLHFRFVRMPAHVSLVITGDNLPAYFIENDQFEEWSASDLDARRKEWQKFQDPATNAAPAGPADEDQFLGEIATQQFISGPLDMPFRVTDVPVPVKDAKTEQARLWAYYQSSANADVFGPSSQKKDDPNYLFHKNYLALTEELRHMYNEVVVPFWNTGAPDAWDRLQKRLIGDPPKRAATDSISVDDLMTPFGEYNFDYSEALKPLKARYEQFENEERRISRRLHDDPKLSKAGVRISAGARAATLWHYYWDTHAQRIKDYETDLVTRPTGAKEPIENVAKTLQPPFMPRDEKHLEPID